MWEKPWGVLNNDNELDENNIGVGQNIVDDGNASGISRSTDNRPVYQRTTTGDGRSILWDGTDTYIGRSILSNNTTTGNGQSTVAHGTINGRKILSRTTTSDGRRIVWDGTDTYIGRSILTHDTVTGNRPSNVSDDTASGSGRCIVYDGAISGRSIVADSTINGRKILHRTKTSDGRSIVWDGTDTYIGRSILSNDTATGSSRSILSNDTGIGRSILSNDTGSGRSSVSDFAAAFNGQSIISDGAGIGRSILSDGAAAGFSRSYASDRAAAGNGRGIVSDSVAAGNGQNIIPDGATAGASLSSTSDGAAAGFSRSYASDSAAAGNDRGIVSDSVATRNNQSIIPDGATAGASLSSTSDGAAAGVSHKPASDDTSTGPGRNTVSDYTTRMCTGVCGMSIRDGILTDTGGSIVSNYSSTGNVPVGRTTGNDRSITFDDSATVTDFELKKLLIDGKTKQIYDYPAESGRCILMIKDGITQSDSFTAQYIQDIVQIFNTINGQVFKLLNDVGVNTAYIEPYSDRGFFAKKCKMIPIKWETRRIAAGPYLRRNPSVQEGHIFTPLNQEKFYKDDANNDPQWSDSEIISAKFCFNGLLIEQREIDIMKRTTFLVFEILEKAFATRNFSLVDMKVEYGVDENGNILLADMIGPETWRIWPSFNKKMMIDNEVYGNFIDVEYGVLERVKNDSAWLSDQLNYAIQPKQHLVVILLTLNTKHCGQIYTSCEKLGLTAELRFISESESLEDIIRIMCKYESTVSDLVFLVDTSRPNCLTEVPSGRIIAPIINCPAGKHYAISARPGLRCPTVLLPTPAALHAAQILALNNYIIWAKLRAKQLKYFIKILNQE